MVTSKQEFLGKLPIFADLYEDELQALAQICDEYEFDQESVIAYQRDVADRLYIVRSGRLFARSVDDRGIVRETRSYFAGNYFDDVWLFAPEAHPATVLGGRDGRLLVIESGKFLGLLEKNKSLLDRMAPVFDDNDEVVAGLSEAAWEAAQKSRIRADKRRTAVNLLADELVEFYARRSRWYLLVKIFGPVLGLLIFPLLAFALINGDPGTVLSTAQIVVPALLLLIFGLIFGFQLLDWTNDYFVITNKHLVHREFELRHFRTNINKIPIDQVQSVEIDRPTFLANLFNYGTARITTAAQNRVLYFDNIDNPHKVQDTLNEMRQRVQALDAGRAQATMRQSIESHFQAETSFRPVQDEQAETKPDIQEESFWRSFRKRYQSRVVENGVITYRKHYFVLFGEIAWPFGIMMGLALLSLILVRGFEFTLLQLSLPMTLLGLIDLAWLIWRMEDWRNDTFQLTDRYVIDIDRRPFGFGESRKQAELSNVQNINSDRPSFWATIFNYGNVIVETAGATADITFENVSHPNRIQSDIFKMRDQFRQKQRVSEGERRRKEYAVLLDVYQQAQEQARIPRRTPPPEEEFEG